MKSKQIYLEAARRIAEREESFSCNAVGRITAKPNEPTKTGQGVTEYRELFEEDWPLYAGDKFLAAVLNGAAPDEADHLRVMLLLFAAEALS